MADFREQTRHELLEKRMLRFAADVIRTLEQQPALPRSTIDQLTRSATSIGANYAEACNVVSKLDFRNKIYAAKKRLQKLVFGSIFVVNCLTKVHGLVFGKSHMSFSLYCKQLSIH